MGREEATARSLVKSLTQAGISARAEGSGVHWRVEFEPAGSRTLRVHCFWYHEATAGPILGTSLSNGRSRFRMSLSSPTGPEYLVTLRDDSSRITDGRTHEEADVIACAREWLRGTAVEDLSLALPFIDRKPRAMRALAQRLDPVLRWEIGSEPLCELWIYNGQRSCKAALIDDSITCAFLFGQAQIAFAEALADVPAAVATWLVEHVSIRQLASRVPRVELEPHAEVLETDPARWHWLRVRDWIADPNDVLAPLRDLIESLAASPIATSFYSFSSHCQLCFSASSHYPWVAEGLPVVAPTPEGAYVIGEASCDRVTAIELIETTLSGYPIRPFFGSAPHHELAPISECLVRNGSALRPQLVQRGAWYRLEVTSGTRQCVVNDRHVAFRDGLFEINATWPSLEDAVDAIRRFLEDGASLDSLAEHPLAERVGKSGPGFVTLDGRTTKLLE